MSCFRIIFLCMIATGCSNEKFRASTNTPDNTSSNTDIQQNISQQSTGTNTTVEITRTTSIGKCADEKKGRLVVANDEWILSNYGITQSADGRKFAANLAMWLAKCKSGKNRRIHAYSNDFSLTGSILAEVLREKNIALTTGVDGFELSAANLARYDWIFIAGYVPNLQTHAQIFIDYIKSGGGMYIAAGTGSTGSYATDAINLNPIVNTFGIVFSTSPNQIVGNIPVPHDSHPLFAGIGLLYHDNGNGLSLNASAGTATKMLATYNGQGLIAAYQAP